MIRQYVLAAMIAVVSVGCAATRFLAYKADPDYPRIRDERLALACLDSEATVVFDRAGVPHVHASNMLDMVRAVGFVQARDRLFQMDLLRRIAAGRLSELVGEHPFLGGTTVGFDLAMRGWDLHGAAMRDLEVSDKDTRAMLDAFADGVNAAMHRYTPLEYRLLDVEPEPWDPEDTLAVARLVGWTITHNWQEEVVRLLLAVNVGLDRAIAVYPPEPPRVTTSLEEYGTRHMLPPAVAPKLRDVLSGPLSPGSHPTASDTFRTPPIPVPGASNAWVIGPGLSASGRPILANDPHLSHTLPSLFYQVHMHAPGFDVIGAAVPGVPVVVAGHNERVAWGITSTVADLVDLCVEKTDPARPGMVAAPGGWVPVTVQRLVIKVRDGSRVRERHFTIRRTRNGPALNDMYPGLLPDRGPLVTVRSFQEPSAGGLNAFMRAAMSRDVAGLRQALQDLAFPVNTWTAADVDGNIGLFVAGEVPARRNHLGTFPVPGWDAKYDWSGSIRTQDLPHALAMGRSFFAHSNPGGGGEYPSVEQLVVKRPFFAHANNLVVEPSAVPFPVQVDSAPSYRIDRIVELLSGKDRFDTDDMAAMQLDTRLGRAARVLPRMIEDLDGVDGLERSALDILTHWDFQAGRDSAAATIFFTTYVYAARSALDDELPGHALDFALSRRYTSNVIDEWFQDRNNPVWDDTRTGRTETRTDVVRAAFTRAVRDLARDFESRDPRSWKWSEVHRLEFRHPFGGRKALADLVNLPPVGLPGGISSVWKTHFDMGDADRPFRVVAGPAWRMVLDLADIRHGMWILDTGESGWPGSPHYGDQFRLWRKGGYEPMVSDWKELRDSPAGTLVLVPGHGPAGR